MIESYRCKKTEKLSKRDAKHGLPDDLPERVAQRKLAALDSATNLIDLRVPPGNCLEKLKGDRKGQHSIRINDKYRLCFEWNKGNANDVEIVDYH